MKKHPIERLVKILDTSQARLARDIGVDRSTVGRWLTNNKDIPSKHHKKLEVLARKKKVELKRTHFYV